MSLKDMTASERFAFMLEHNGISGDDPLASFLSRLFCSTPEHDLPMLMERLACIFGVALGAAMPPDDEGIGDFGEAGRILLTMSAMTISALEPVDDDGVNGHAVTQTLRGLDS